MRKKERKERDPGNILGKALYFMGFVCAKANMIKDEAIKFFQDTGISEAVSGEPAVIGAEDGEKQLNDEFEKEIKEIRKKNGRQLNALYTYFGSFLYENIVKENIYYCFGSENARCEEEANSLLQKIKNSREEEMIQAGAKG